ncbi:MAG: sulfatase [Planctomycetes bacterium]|nr:sulfatase [Planctomycetota bacterium]
MKKSLISFVVLLSSLCLSSLHAGERPNVLFIAVDDLNDYVGCLGGHKDTLTPNIDRLAQEGTLFSNAHCAAPLCSPSRISVATGKYPKNTGYYMNSQGNFRQGLSAVTTLPEYFRSNGYTTLGRGKLWPDTPVGFKKSFDEYMKVNKKEVGNINKYIFNNGPKGRFKEWVLDGGPLDIEDEQMVDGSTAKWAEARLNNFKFNKPFFMGVGIFRPHIDWFVPRKYFKSFDPEKISLPMVKKDDLADVSEIAKEIANGVFDEEAMERSGQRKVALAAYLACVHFADAMIGRVLNALEKSPHANNTIVVLWSDHGYHLGEKQHWRKMTLWEDATRVPMIIKLPKGHEQVATSRQPVSLVDLYPTLVDLCSLPKNEALDGQSVVSLLKNPNAKSKKPALISYGFKNHCLRTEDFSFIHYSDGSCELYDMNKDPHQWTNLAANPEYQNVVDEMKSYLPKDDEPYKANHKGNSNIKMWHETFDYIKGRDIDFADW